MRTFAVIPRSKSQTSPRLGAIFLLVEKGEKRATGLSYLIVLDCPRVEGKTNSEKLSGENPFLRFGQFVEFFQKLSCLLAHIEKLTPVYA